MDPQTIDSEYTKLQEEVQQVAQAINALAQKLQAGISAGDANAQEWLSDLRAIAIEVQDEQSQVQNLLQAMHGFTVTSLQQHAGAIQQALGQAQAGLAQAGLAQAGYGQAGFGQQGYPPQGYGQPGYGQGYPGGMQPGMVQEEMMQEGAMGGGMMGNPMMGNPMMGGGMMGGMEPMMGGGMGGMGGGMGGGGIVGRIENEVREHEVRDEMMGGGGMMGGGMLGGPQGTLDRFLGGSFSQGMAQPHEGFIERHIRRDML